MFYKKTSVYLYHLKTTYFTDWSIKILITSRLSSQPRAYCLIWHFSINNKKKLIWKWPIKLPYHAYVALRFSCGPRAPAWWWWSWGCRPTDFRLPSRTTNSPGVREPKSLSASASSRDQDRGCQSGPRILCLHNNFQNLFYSDY